MVFAPRKTPGHGPGTAATALAVLVLAATAAAGCGGLTRSPGAGFAVKVHGTQPRALVGQVVTPLRFTVTDCDAFDAAVESAGVAHAIEAARQADGTFLSSVPVEWLRAEDHSCVDDAHNQLRSVARLVVTCRDAGRTAAAELAVSYGTATRATDLRNGFVSTQFTARQYLFASGDPLDPYLLWPAPYGQDALLTQMDWIRFWIDPGASSIDPLVRPRLVELRKGVLVSSACTTRDSCLDLPVSPDRSVPSQPLRYLAPDESFHVGYPVYLGASFPVAANVQDLAVQEDGAVVVLSQAQEEQVAPFARAITVVSRVVVTPAVVSPSGGSTAPTALVTVIGAFPGEWAESRLSRAADGTLAFLSLTGPAEGGALRSLLHRTDGHTVTTQLDPEGGLDLGEVVVTGSSRNIYPSDLQLSPDGTVLLVSSGSSAVLGEVGSTFAQIPTTIPPYGDTGGVAWPDGAAAVWTNWAFSGRAAFEGGVEVFDAAPPHALRFRYLVESLATGFEQPGLLGVTAVGDKLVLTTSSGVRVLGPDGALVGGSDPLPCGLSPSGPAERTGPTTFAVAAGRALYVFDLAAVVEPMLWVQEFQTTDQVLTHVWGAGPRDVWAVGTGGAIIHWDGGRWASVPGESSSLYAVWGRSSSDVWAVGANGTRLHWNGSAWSRLEGGLSTGSTLNGLWGSGSSDVWAVGEGGAILHWDGATWSASPAPAGTGDLHGVWGSGSGDAWAVGVGGAMLHWDGTTWSAVAPPLGVPGDLHRIWGNGPSDLWVVGRGGAVLHWNGSGWSLEILPMPLVAVDPSADTLVAVWGTGPDDVWAVGDGLAIFHWDGARWSLSPVPAGAEFGLGGVWAWSADDVWVVGNGGALHRSPASGS